LNNQVVDLISYRFLYGVNRWSYSSVLETIIDIGVYEAGPTLDIPQFNERLLQLLPSLIEHHCSEGQRGGFMQRLHEGTWLGHVLEHVVIELQRLVGLPFSFGQTRQIKEFESRYYMVFASSHENIAKQAFQEGCSLVDACVLGMHFNLSMALEKIRRVVMDCDGGISLSQQMVEAKRARMPFLRPPGMKQLQYGYGCDRTYSPAAFQSTCCVIGLANPINLKDFMLFLGYKNIAFGDDVWSILQSPDVDMAIIETSLDKIQSRGMVYQYPHCHVAIVNDIQNADDISCYRCHVDTIDSSGYIILNIDNPHVRALKEYAEAKIIYFSMQSFVEHLCDKLQNNDVLYWERNQYIYCWENQEQRCLGKFDLQDKESIQKNLIYFALAKSLNISDGIVFSFIKNSVLIS
jgi:Cyanophycin synthase-like N-terminal domain